MREDREREAMSSGGGGGGFAMPPPPGGRGAGRGLSNLPAWMVEQKRNQQLQQQGGSAEPSPGQPGQFADPEGPPGGAGGAAAAAASKKRALFRNPTRVLLMKNMVAPGNVAGLADEVGGECAKFGPVRSCVVYEHAQGPGVAEEEVVRTLVAFETQGAAIKAFMDMEGRFFDGRQVRTSAAPAEERICF